MTGHRPALVDGVATWVQARERQHDLDHMVRCCMAELLAMEEGGPVAAPYYFQRTAVLLRKAKDHRREVQVCEAYLAAAEAFYARNDAADIADVRLGSTYLHLVHRLAKARALMSSAAA